MSNTQILQWLQSANGRIPSDALNRIAKSVWQTVSAPLKAMYALGPTPSSPPGAVFFADAFRPFADGASSQITLRRGLAIRIDPSTGDTWDGDVKPLYADVDQVVALTQNTDASGDDRIDLVVIRPRVELEDPQAVLHKDTLEGPVYSSTVPTRRNLGFELAIIEGAPNAAPATPPTPNGWVAVCAVLRPHGQAAILQDDVTDLRVREWMASLALGRLYFGKANGTHYRIERDDDEAPTRLRIRNQNELNVGLEVGDLVSSGEVITDRLQVRSDYVGDAIDLWNHAADGYGAIVARNTPIAMVQFQFPDWQDPDDGDPATLVAAWNVTSVVYKDADPEYALITFDVPIPDEGAAIVLVTAGQSLGGGSAAPTDDLPSAYVESGGATARVYWASGTVPTLQRYHIVVWGVS